MDIVLFYLRENQILKINNKYLRFKILDRLRRLHTECLQKKEKKRTNKKGECVKIYTKL